jgi:hypothetical protein
MQLKVYVCNGVFVQTPVKHINFSNGKVCFPTCPKARSRLHVRIHAIDKRSADAIMKSYASIFSHTEFHPVNVSTLVSHITELHMRDPKNRAVLEQLAGGKQLPCRWPLHNPDLTANFDLFVYAL